MKQLAPRSIRALDKEVKHWTEIVSDGCLLDVVAALMKRLPNLDRSYDIPYIAGYSKDGRTVFIDRHLPRSFVYKGRRIATDRFIATHEIVEKVLLDQLKLHYLHAHQIALRVEEAAVRAAGVDWHDYNAFTKGYEKEIGSERLQRVPRALDLTPYEDEGDFALLKRMAVAA
jgi:hypothetical protein